jgi:hypothetical protein
MHFNGEASLPAVKSMFLVVHLETSAVDMFNDCAEK